MPQKKGTSGNPKGRPKGTPNKTTSEIRQWISCLIERNLPQLEADLANLSPKDRLVILEKLMQYALPKASQLNIPIDQLSESEIEMIIKKL